MGGLLDLIRRFFKEEDGVTAIEYALIAALISVVIIVAVTLVGDNLSAIYDSVASDVVNAVNQ